MQSISYPSTTCRTQRELPNWRRCLEPDVGCLSTLTAGHPQGSFLLVGRHLARVNPALLNYLDGNERI
jgi:hypothetical protein